MNTGSYPPLFLSSLFSQFSQRDSNSNSFSFHVKIQGIIVSKKSAKNREESICMSRCVLFRMVVDDATGIIKLIQWNDKINGEWKLGEMVAVWGKTEMDRFGKFEKVQIVVHKAGRRM